MKYITAILAMLFALSVNMAPAAADPDKQRYEKSENYKNKQKHESRDKDGYKDKKRDNDKDRDRDHVKKPNKVHKADPKALPRAKTRTNPVRHPLLDMKKSAN